MAGRRGSTCDAYSKREYPARVRLTVTKRRLIYVLSKGAVRVVVHRPATVDELELSARDELPRESSVASSCSDHHISKNEISQ